MATSKKKTPPKKSAAKRSQSNARGRTTADALLMADHRKVEGLFKKFDKAEADSEKSALAKQICGELIIHTMLEEEIFYPACREAGVDDDDMDEAQVEHDGAKVMIGQLMEGEPSDDYYVAKMTVLSEYIKHHVKEEEEPRKGIFAKARKAGVDMAGVGEQIAARKAELKANETAVTSKPPEPVSLAA